MNSTKDLEKFLVEARAGTYVGNTGFVKSALNGSKQLEYRDGDLLYRDVYYAGKDKFYGIETVFDDDKPVFGMSYYGNWGNMTEDEIDKILRGALMANPETRLNKQINWEKDGFRYSCQPDIAGDLAEIGGTETISKGDEQVYAFYYAGGMLI